MSRSLNPPCVSSRATCKLVGRISWPVDYGPGDERAHASAYVCADDQHQRETAAWVYGVTGHLGEFVPFSDEMRTRLAGPR